MRETQNARGRFDRNRTPPNGIIRYATKPLSRDTPIARNGCRRTTRRNRGTIVSRLDCWRNRAFAAATLSCTQDRLAIVRALTIHPVGQPGQANCQQESQPTNDQCRPGCRHHARQRHINGSQNKTGTSQHESNGRHQQPEPHAGSKYGLPQRPPFRLDQFEQTDDIFGQRVQ